MTISHFKSNGDILQRFTIAHTHVRGGWVSLHDSYQQIMRQHAYPPVIQQLLGETLVAAVLLTANIKFTGELTLQFYGASPIRTLVAKCTDSLNIRAVAQYEPDALQTDILDAFAQGKLVVSINRQGESRIWQSIIPIERQTITHSIMQYFAESEQIATAINLAVSDEQACGLLLQKLPHEDTLEDIAAWQQLKAHMEQITAEQLLSDPTATLLSQLSSDQAIQLFAGQSVQFHCNCSRERAIRAILLMGQAEVEDILRQHRVVEVNCEYCNNQFVFDREDIQTLFAGDNPASS
jgi:molecular chaperone Hsp33